MTADRAVGEAVGGGPGEAAGSAGVAVQGREGWKANTVSKVILSQLPQVNTAVTEIGLSKDVMAGTRTLAAGGRRRPCGCARGCWCAG